MISAETVTIGEVLKSTDLDSAEEDIRRAMAKLKRAKAPSLFMLAQRLAGEIQMLSKKARSE